MILSSLVTSTRYSVIYADPPWRYDNIRTGGSLSSGASQKYNTLSLDDLLSLNIPAAENSVLFLWVTTPFLGAGFGLMKAWGFNYKTTFVWVKEGRIGMGFWFRVNTEELLVGTRGKIRPFRSNFKNYLISPPSKHSHKPDEVRKMIETICTGLEPKLEMFATQEHDGWDVWGDEL